MKLHMKRRMGLLCVGKGAALILFCCLGLAPRGRAEDASLTNVMAAAELHEKSGETADALKGYLEAEKLAPNDSEIQCRLAKMYCDSMNTTPDKAAKKDLAQKALDAAQNAVKDDPKSPKAHCCVAVCYAKNFPYLDNQTKVNYSRQIKAEAEAAIAADPTFDLAYHMLGRWNFEVSNMGFLVKGMIRLAYGGLPKASKMAAIDNFKKAVELKPTRVINHLQLARMYHITDQESLVSDELKKCAALEPIDMDDKNAQTIAKNVLAGEKWPEEF